ncbi:uncharacterized protein FA14DRAFT_61589 [Meira miltonrushii]|uniref:NYN domain-containing protein n=1 Tax=Meira miltonrushii TaxID=1280837 RepID=A0A316V777_9BASI|nr:uncharacterized protein FA14DRAFT_61589 [Meira miltonrushii]PWN33376.1 hypothetical protein FA14DRAFT_61589 [Meira miltonrushii]
MEGGTDGFGGGVANLLASPAVRNASLACLAAASVFLSYKSLTNSNNSSKDDKIPPRLPEKDEKYQKKQGAGKTSASPSKKKYDGVIDTNSQEISRPSNGFSHQKDESRSNSMSSVYTTQTDYNDTRGGTSSEQVSSGFTKTPIAIFWDMDNCSPNSGASGQEVATKIRRAAQSAGPDRNKIGMITSFKAYLEVAEGGAGQIQLRSELQGSGVSLIDTPKSGRKDVADKMMIADLLSYAIDRRPPALIVLLSGDRDFAYPLGILRNRGYDILLITPPIGASPILEASATYKLRWRQDVLGIEYDASGRPYNSSNNVAKSQANGGTAVGVQTSHPSTQSPPRPIKPQDTANNIPPVFQPLVTILETMSEEGDKRPLRSKVSPRLRALDPKVFDKAQASGWTEYTQIASAAGIVVLGSGVQTGFEWIALRKNIETDARSFIPDQVIINPGAVVETEDGKIEPFFPLIEAYKSLKAGLPATKEPSARSISDALDAIAERGQFDPYKAAGVKTFDHYIKTAFKAKVARLAPGDNGPVVEMHPNFATMHTGLIMPSNPSARMLDTANIPAPESKPNRLTNLLSGNKQENDSKNVALPSPSKSSAQDISKDRSYDPFKLPSSYFAHQPSNEMINVSFFPLVNFMLTRRLEGDFSVPENQVHMSVSKHHKLGRSVQSWRQFKGYLQVAIEEKIVTIIDTRDHEYRYVRLHDRLTKGADSGKHLGFQKGHYSTHGKTNDNAAQQETSAVPTGPKHSPTKPTREPKKDEKEDHVRPIVEQPSAQFNTIPSTSADRQKFKTLIEILVSIRKEAIAKAKDLTGQEQKDILKAGTEPVQLKVATGMMDEDGKKAGESKQPPTPAAWLQKNGFSSFSDLFKEAEQKGFVHLFVRENKSYVRLSQKYEDMFFRGDASKS